LKYRQDHGDLVVT